MNPLINIWHDLQASGQLYPPPNLLTKHIAENDAISLYEADDFQDFIAATISDQFNTDAFPYKTLVEFLLTSQSDGLNPVLDPAQHQKYEDVRVLPFLDGIKKEILKGIASSLRSRFFAGGMPSYGVCLVYTRELRSAYLISYDLRNAPPELKIIDRIDRPKGVLELESISALRNPAARNLAKSFLTSGHKIVLQNGILTHVDRRVDQGVFGPTIDTLLLSDIALNDVDPRAGAPRALEVGSGSGHVISAVASKTNGASACTFIDISPTAVSCTWKNLVGNLKHRKKFIDRKYGVIGPFDAALFKTTYDLVVCNPPYIALPPKEILSDHTKYRDAVAGTNLIKTLLDSLPTLLSETGRLLMMTSSTSLSAVEDAMPQGFAITNAYRDAISVPFDVEAVLEDTGWIDHLSNLGAIKFESDTYWHELRPAWIERTCG
jgi:methylase of polypeptide subunit release factors